MGKIQSKKMKMADDEIMKLTDLSDYCLEQIFNHLCLEDLMNIAFSNTTLQ